MKIDSNIANQIMYNIKGKIRRKTINLKIISLETEVKIHYEIKIHVGSVDYSPSIENQIREN